MPSCNILRWSDIMLSFEPHSTIVPPSPTPVISPYFHASFLGHGAFLEKSKFSAGLSFVSKGPVKTGGDYNMLQGTCCGYMDVHLGLLTNVLYPLMTAFSSSKSLFVSGTTKSNGANVACAVLVFMNMNLNCASPVSMPLGVVYAFNTVQAGMSWGDILAGVVSGLVQVALEKVAGAALGAAVSRSGLSNAMGSRLLLRSVSSNVHVAQPLARAVGKYCTTNPVIGALIANEVGKELSDIGVGLVLDRTSAEDSINSSTTDWIGSDDSDYL